MKTNKLLFQICLTVSLVALFMLPASLVQGQTSPAQIGIFEPLTVAPDTLVEIPIQVKDISEMYAIDLELHFDPAILQAQDADENQPGIQLGFGSFLDPGLLLFNTVDNDQGIVHVVISQVNPSEPKSGSGILFVLYVKGMQEGVSDLKITNLQVADRTGLEIAVSAVENKITIDEAALQIDATAIPVINPTAMILIPTEAPTPIPTVAPQSTATPRSPTLAPTSAGLAVDQQPSESAANSAESPAETQGFSLLENWWILVLVAVVLLGLGYYLVRSRPKD